MVEIHERISILKKQENDCYSMCFYLLQCEKLACEAAKDALYNLVQSDSFFNADCRTQAGLLRKESMMSALQIKKKCM
ncbi:MAG: hypothetical protein K0S39_3901 [Paenibacillus sp.]|jgi:hypothetical protein|nr:hypothetical protein [Paenibacillus sp.]